ncbi:hypothetical protein FRC10_003163, partial [Ceratobasidium sp. 414]
MLSYQLSEIRTRTSQLVSAPTISLHTILDSSPEPMATALGVVPNQAPLDDCAATLTAVSEPEDQTRRYSQRVRISTEKIASHNEEVAVREAKRKNRKSRTTSISSIASEQSTVPNHVSDSDTGPPRDIVDESQLAEEQLIQDFIDRVVSRHAMLQKSSANRVPEVSEPTIEDSRDVDGAASGTVGAGETETWDFSADHERLESELSRLADADPEELAQISPRNLKAILQELQADRSLRLQAREVQPPKLKAQAKPVTNNPIAVGGGHHLDVESNLNRRVPLIILVTTIILTPLLGPVLSYRDIEPENTDTEPESELEDQLAKPTTTVRNLAANSTNRPSPSGRTPTSPGIRRLLDLPLNHPRNTSGTTQAPTQPDISANRTPQPSLSRTSSHQASQASLANRSLPHAPSHSVSQTQPSPVTRRRQTSGHAPRPRTMHPALTETTSSTNAAQTQRASKVPSRAPELHQGGTARLPLTMTQAANLAHTRRRLRGEHEQRTQEWQAWPSNVDGLTSSGAVVAPAHMPSPPDIMEDDEEERVAMEADANGQDPKHGHKKKPAARDIHGNERQVLTVAKLHLFAYSIVEGAYQTRGLVTRWAHPVYELT